MRQPARHRALEIGQVAFNLLAIVILVVRGVPSAWLGANLVLLAFVIFAVPRLVTATDWRRHLGDVYFLPAFMFYYLETSILHTAVYRGLLLDGFLWRTDAALFGVQPSLLVPRLVVWPWAGELMSLAYLAFYPLVIVAGLSRLLRLVRDDAYDRLLNAMAVTFVSSYVLFTLIPTAGPRYALADKGVSLAGYVATPFLQAMLTLAERPTGAFPSSHVAFAVMLTCWCWTYARRAFWPLLLLTAILPLATVYVQAHYAVDALAGLGFGMLTWRIQCALTPPSRKVFAGPPGAPQV